MTFQSHFLVTLLLLIGAVIPTRSFVSPWLSVKVPTGVKVPIRATAEDNQVPQVDSSTASTSSTGTNTRAPVRAYMDYTFAPNGVCISPARFVVTNNNMTEDGNSDDDETPSYFTMKSVPGEGDCMFLAVALATLTTMGLGANDFLLRAISRETRNVVATVLEAPEGNLVVEGRRLVSTKTLLQSATRAEGLASTAEYLEQLRTEGRDGGLYGGGPELTVLANILRRPISIYEVDEIVEVSNNTNDDYCDDDNDDDTCYIERKGMFGRGFFQDALWKVPDSAVFTNDLAQMGAYRWHLHILVVNVGGGEKHACVLLPKYGDVDSIPLPPMEC